MKMSKRVYNILFHIHTISGIVISAVLYVIFFAGSFSFFRDEIISWERNEAVKESSIPDLDLNVMMDTLNQRHETYGRDISFSKYLEDRRIAVNLSAPKDTTAQQEGRGRRGDFFYLGIDDFKTYNYASNYSIGEFLYRLHFLAQLNLYGRSGYLIAGIVSFFFLFAIVTGVLVHWKKIVSNFYVFRPKASLKNVWTDAHTALGILGLPYQFIFAVTGVFLIVGTTIMSPPVLSIIHDGNTEKMYDDFGFGTKEFPMAMEKQEAEVDLNSFVALTKERWPDFYIKAVHVYNYGDANMHVAVTGHPEYSSKLLGEGELVFKANSGEIVSEKEPFQQSSYVDGASGILYRLHFGDFGGVGLRVVYFILGIVSCFVIISGVLIWLVARDKKNVEEKKRKFNAWLGWVYLSICLSMYPATAFTFLVVKLFVFEFDATRMTSIYQIFFYSWLAFIVLFTAKRDNFFTNQFCLIIGAVLGFLVPIANGIISGNWIWITYVRSYDDILLIDLFWLILSVITFVVAIRLKRKDSGKAKARPAASKRPLVLTNE
ncbi:PepSY-associated TM helix domain-containing protein [Catalinimonas niigatensis]|uniref:PepSY-associated TM helix domain-containing protein n=1 Tax=Catalinimonas niigatensis TaxID=1397264 RepID=UPI002666A49C|nr:PepSY-associated TM helix domain-containing protein [Catalinimonas niigatensis]WPP49736.1 PepSY-associated TM helix domain-containing protein [Catalinimonas niigatensis]